MAFLIDSIEARFYRFVADLNKNDLSLNVAYIGTDSRHFPVYPVFWREKNISDGLPKEPEWVEMSVEVKNGKANFYWNNKELEGSLDVSRIKDGFVGIYTNFVGGFGEAEANIDNFYLRIVQKD